ncbi:branched-chain amino acid ABC transporter permease [Egibacter rhizosphaerae]|uniref:Branched-chain amino acid ABC transporter permease n=1 Tax=Egibacter rhizosphaerae TaxID=1670831 RepID=A0A411YI90_9ACTN|nr:branched-chain amino acid ABC transporter permease [Egibacter rhizosphaerae]QBI20861.1 branched-chain amino acid ABC transporter permease [Egibacter rhizosphaerae]
MQLPTMHKGADTAGEQPETGQPRRSLRTGAMAALTAGALLAVIAFGLWSPRQGWISLAATIFMYMAMVQAWNVLSGYAKYLNLGTAAFFGVGVYTSTILAETVPLHHVATPLIGGLVAAAAATVIGFAALSLRGASFVIFTLALSFFVQTLARNVEFTRGGLGMFAPVLPFDGVTTARAWYFIFFGVALVVTVAVFALERTRFGDALRAIGEDEDGAVVLGVRATRIKLAAFAAGAFIAAVIGGLHAYRVGYIEPVGAFELIISVNVVVMGVIGGLGRWQGPLIGAPLVLILAEIMRAGVLRLQLLGTNLPVESYKLMLGVLVVLIALYARDGIAGLFSERRQSRLGV